MSFADALSFGICESAKQTEKLLVFMTSFLSESSSHRDEKFIERATQKVTFSLQRSETEARLPHNW
jgi:hypothetical protein